MVCKMPVGILDCEQPVGRWPAGQSQRSSLDKMSADILEIAAKLQDPQGAKPVGEASKRVKVGRF